MAAHPGAAGAWLQAGGRPSMHTSQGAAARGISDLPLVQDASSLCTTKTSNFQREISQVLQSLDLPHEMELQADATAFISIDLAFPAQRVALEADGPYHFFTNTLQPNGAPSCLQLCLRCHRQADKHL